MMMNHTICSKMKRHKIYRHYIMISLLLMSGFFSLHLFFTALNHDSIDLIEKEWNPNSTKIIDGRSNRTLYNTLDNNDTDSLPRVLCWIMTNPRNHRFRATRIKETWGKRCNYLLFVSSEQDPELPSLKINVGEDSRNTLWGKTKRAFQYIHENYREKADWFMKADDDTFVIVENLRYMLKDYRPNDPIYFGFRLNQTIEQGYMSGGAGYVLSQETLDRFVNLALRGKGQKDSCRIDYDDGNEDVELGRCLSGVDVVAGDSRDTDGKERFFPFNPNTQLITENTPNWYWKLMYYDSKNKTSCCSDHPISFHYITSQGMLVLESLIYHVHSYGKEFGSNVVGKLINATDDDIKNGKIYVHNELPKDQASSSSHLGEMDDFGPHLAIDGKLSGKDKGFFSSDAEPYPWLQIKLGRERIVSSLTIVNRIDHSGSRLANLEIRSGYYELKNNSGTEKIVSNDLCGHFDGPGEDGQIYSINCDAPLPAKYVTIQIVPNNSSLPHAEKRILQLNEVQINELII